MYNVTKCFKMPQNVLTKGFVAFVYFIYFHILFYNLMDNWRIGGVNVA